MNDRGASRRRFKTLCLSVAGVGLIVPVIAPGPSVAARETSTTAEPARDNVVRSQSAPSTFTSFPATGHFHPITPSRLVDSRDGTGGIASPIGPEASMSLQITGTPLGIPSGATAVVLNVTATRPTHGGFLTVYPSGEDVPNASNVNFTPGVSVPNLVTVKIGIGGKVNVFNSAGSTDIVVDVMGWYDSWFDPSVPGGTSVIGVSPQRVLDTRTGNGVSERRARHGGETTTVQIRGRGGVPVDSAVTAVVMNVTAVNPTEDGYLTVFPSDASLPTTSNVNFVRHQTVPNLVMAQLSASGAVSVFNYAGNTDVLFDVVGYATTEATNGGGQFFPVSPTRIVDTRDGTGSSTGRNPIGPAATMHFASGGKGGVPTTGVSAVIINVTAVNPTHDGFLTVYPDDSILTGDASNVNYVAGDVVPNLVLAKAGATGGVAVFNSAGHTEVVIDVVGWFTSDASFDLRTFQQPAMATAPAGDAAIGSVLSSPARASAEALFDATSIATAHPLPVRERVGDGSVVAPAPPRASTGGVQAAAGGFQPDYPTWAAGFPALTQVPAKAPGSLGAIGRLYISLDTNGGTGTCSATVIDTDLVLTAAHCVYEASGTTPDFYRAWGFVPGQFGTVSLTLPTNVNPGFWVTSSAYLLNEYPSVVDPWFGSPGLSSADYAIVKFAPKTINGALTHIADVTGTVPVAVNAPLGPRLVMGYPSGFASEQFRAQCADATNDECYPYFCFSPISSYWLNSPQPGLSTNSFEVGLGCHTPEKLPNGPAPGASGGPWLANIGGTWRVTSVTSNGPVVQDSEGNPSYLRNVWGPYFDDRVTTLVNAATAAG